MLNSTLKLVAVFVLMLGIGFSLSLADDNFQWDKATGDPSNMPDAACWGSPDCLTSVTCQVVNPPVSVIPDGKTTNVLVGSYMTFGNSTYGICTPSKGTCEAYPLNGVKCGDVLIYSDANCKKLWGTKTVYAGNCN